jgi:hypothetical protein
MGASAAGSIVRRLPAWSAPALVGVVGAGAVGVLAWLDPATRAEISPGCPFRRLTGLDCPGCGGTRAVYALTQGDVGLALDHNALVVALVPVLVMVWATWFARRIRYGFDGRAPAPPAVASMSFAVAVMLFWVVRNLPWMPFSWLGSSPAG